MLRLLGINSYFVCFLISRPLDIHTHRITSSPQEDLPPRTELKVSDPQVKPLSLGELALSPSSVLFIKFQTEAYNSECNGSLRSPVLSESLSRQCPSSAAPSSDS